VHLLALDTKLDKILTAAPEWELSSRLRYNLYKLLQYGMLTTLKTNIDSYVVAVMLSSNLHSYKVRDLSIMF